MRIRKSIASATLAAIFWSSPAFAQQHIADPSAIQQALADQQATDTANRAIVLKVLERNDAREMAEHMGLTVTEAAEAVSHLSSQELADLAQPARAIDNSDLSGGATTVVISVTTLLLIIIIVLLIAR